MTQPDSDQLGGPWVGYEGAAEHVGLSETYLRQIVMRGEIPFRKIGRRVLFSVPSLDAWVSRNGAMETSAEAVA